MERAVQLTSEGKTLFASSAFSYFLHHRITHQQFLNDPQILQLFSELDDDDIFCSIKEWCHHEDTVLSLLCKQLRDRVLPKIEISNHPFEQERIKELRSNLAQQMNIPLEAASNFIYTDSVMNKAYSPEGFTIKVAYRDGSIADIADASDQYNITALTMPVTKYFLCYPKK